MIALRPSFLRNRGAGAGLDLDMGGLLLCAWYVLTKRLWLGIGLHAAWNFMQGGVYSGIVSGNGEMTGFFKSSMNGPELLTGGAFGVEASVVALAICSAAGVAMMVMAVKRGHIVAPRWSPGPSRVSLSSATD